MGGGAFETEPELPLSTTSKTVTMTPITSRISQQKAAQHHPDAPGHADLLTFQSGKSHTWGKIWSCSKNHKGDWEYGPQNLTPYLNEHQDACLGLKQMF